jgi:hypothetical protein
VRALQIQLTRRNTVGVEAISLGDVLALGPRLVDRLLHLLGGPEAPTALLVHLGARRNSIDSEEEELLGLDDAEEVRNVGEDGEEDGLLGNAKRRVVVVRVRAVVDDTIHVQICWRGEREPGGQRSARSVASGALQRRTESIKFGYAVLLNQLRDERIPLPEEHPR